MNQSKKNPLVTCILGVICVVLVSALLAPLVKGGLQVLSPYCPVCASLSGYELHRILSRVFMVGIFIFLLLARKTLFAGRAVFEPLSIRSGVAKWFVLGFVLGVITLSLQVIFAIIFDARTFYTTEFTWMRFIQKGIKAVFSASLIGLMEEFIFRGILYGKIKRARSFWLALLVSSLVYSMAHFFQPKDIAPIDHLTIWSGFNVLGQILTPFAAPDFLFESVGLFLVGACLVFAYRYSKSLYCAIGLHAGWVFVIKMDGMMVTRTKPDSIWLWGSSNIVGGIYTWILLISIMLFIRFVIPKIEAKVNGRQD